MNTQRLRLQTKQTVEESVPDVFVVCDKVMQYVTKMVVDEEKQFVLTNYNQVKGEIVVKGSNHNTLLLHMEIAYTTFKPKRVEVFNFKQKENQELFKNITTNTDKLSRCFVSQEVFKIQSGKWLKL